MGVIDHAIAVLESVALCAEILQERTYTRDSIGRFARTASWDHVPNLGDGEGIYFNGYEDAVTQWATNWEESVAVSEAARELLTDADVYPYTNDHVVASFMLRNAKDRSTSAYRGLGFRNEADFQNAVDQFRAGDTVAFDLAAFSNSQSVANEFAADGRYSMVFRVNGRNKAFEILDRSPYPEQEEVVLTGRYRVKSARRGPNPWTDPGIGEQVEVDLEWLME